jgi:hypothetical protein
VHTAGVWRWFLYQFEIHAQLNRIYVLRYLSSTMHVSTIRMLSIHTSIMVHTSDFSQQPEALTFRILRRDPLSMLGRLAPS